MADSKSKRKNRRAAKGKIIGNTLDTGIQRVKAKTSTGARRRAAIGKMIGNSLDSGMQGLKIYANRKKGKKK